MTDGEWVWVETVLAELTAALMIGWALFGGVADALLPWCCADCGRRTGRRRRLLTPAGRLWVCGECRRFWKGLP